MKTPSLLILAALAFTGTSAAAGPQSHDHAHAAIPETAARAKPEVNALNEAFDALDANKDGRLSREELAKTPKGAHAPMVDADRDGSLDRTEFKALQDM